MNNKGVWQLFLAFMVLAGIAAFAMGGQQPPTAKPAQSATQTPQSASPSAGTAGSAGTPAAEPSPDTVVMKVGDMKITKEAIDALIAGMNPQGKQALAMQGRKPLGDQYSTLLVLSLQAVSDHLDSSPAIRERIELQRQQTLASAEFDKLSKEIQPTPDEVAQYFAAHQPEFERVDMREFFIRKRPANLTDAKLGLTDEEAKAKADAIRQAVVAGTDIKKVAEQFAVPNVVTIDTATRPMRHHTLPPPLEDVAFSLKDNEVSQPVNSPQGVALIQVTGHSHPELKDVTPEIQTKLKKQKYDAKLDDLKKQFGVWMDDQYFSGPPANPLAPASAGAPPPPPATQAPKR